MSSLYYPGFAHVPERLCLWSGIAAVLVVPAALSVPLPAFPAAPHRLKLHQQLCIQQRRRQEVVVEPRVEKKHFFYFRESFRENLKNVNSKILSYFCFREKNMQK
jgi:hypothetical protein